MNSYVFNIVRDVLCSIVSPSLVDCSVKTKLLGDVPEFDSMIVVNLLNELEDRFNAVFDDSEIDASMFETVGSLCAVLEEKISSTGAS